MVPLPTIESVLGITFPSSIASFLENNENYEAKFGDEEWLFSYVDDDPDHVNDSYMLKQSLSFREEWSLNGVVIGDNGIGDYLVLLPDTNGTLSDQIYVLMHETAEIKVFANSMESLLERGPEDYFGSNEFVYRLEGDEVIRFGGDPTANAEPYSEEEDSWEKYYNLKSTLDDWIDDVRTDKASELLSGLETLTECGDEQHRTWALNKFSDIYLRGFGPIPADLPKALEYNQRAMDEGSHKAFSNRSACYFAGIGVEKDLQRALELARHANELSKKNLFASAFSEKEDGGLYEDLVEMIEKVIKTQQKPMP